MKFSLIVPVYNVEKYLCKCLDSILSQNYTDFELLLIDDGSTDKSGDICDEYSTLHKNIKVYHKENGGLSEARNYGLRYAKGDYIVFIDSDDWIESNSLMLFSEALGNKNFDVLITRLVEVYEDEIRYKDTNFSKYLERNLSKDRAIKWIMKYSQNSWPAPKYIVSRKLINDNQLHFLKGRLHEDLDWTTKICYVAKSYCGLSAPWYYHRMGRVGSITNTIKLESITDVIEMAAYHYDLLKNNNNNLLDNLILQRLMCSVYSSIYKIRKCKFEDINSISKCIDENIRIFTVAPKFKYKVFVASMNVLGINRTLKLFLKK